MPLPLRMHLPIYLIIVVLFSVSSCAMGSRKNRTAKPSTPMASPIQIVVPFSSLTNLGEKDDISICVYRKQKLEPYYKRLHEKPIVVDLSDEQAGEVTLWTDSDIQVGKEYSYYLTYISEDGHEVKFTRTFEITPDRPQEDFRGTD